MIRHSNNLPRAIDIGHVTVHAVERGVVLFFLSYGPLKKRKRVSRLAHEQHDNSHAINDVLSNESQFLPVRHDVCDMAKVQKYSRSTFLRPPSILVSTLKQNGLIGLLSIGLLGVISSSPEVRVLVGVSFSTRLSQPN